MNLKKDKWIQNEIGFVAKEINEKIINPYINGCSKFVRPEDLTEGDFYVNSFRSPEDVGSGKYCYKDDILFARRSVSISEFKKRSNIIKFDAVCSDEITVIRQDNKKLCNGFLNLILNTNNLWSFAISSSVGSVSKRIKWEDLSKYKFYYPEKTEEQKQIASLFQSIETAIEKVEGQEKKLKTLQKLLVNGLLNIEPVFGDILNKENCTQTTFGDIAECDKKYPEHANEVLRYIGLENIVTENFQLQGYGEIANGTTFTKRFTKGDVLFGKRRAYLKKVAVADFDGVCSGDILVIRAKSKKMLQALLPFYISADVFIQHAISTSAGSLSPRTKWKDLAEMEVTIPDLEIQEKILEILQQIETTIT
ncbi:MAG: restriction endonuclease subunit S [Bacteroidota bacterium]